jgi:hypothetical protein
MAYLEDKSNLPLVENIISNKANAADLKNRYPVVYGKKL